MAWRSEGAIRTQQRAHHTGLVGSFVFAINLKFLIAANSLFQNLTSPETRVRRGTAGFVPALS